MGQMLDCLKQAIVDDFIPIDQKYMSESFIIGRTPQSMSCEIFPYKGQEYLLCQFDRQGFNNQSFPYFNSDVDGLVCMCDYILFVEELDRMLVLLLELKHDASPQKQVRINLSFARFICERLKTIFDTSFIKPCVYRKIGIRERYKPLHSTQDYVFEFDETDYALLPNPSKIMLGIVSKVIS